VESITEGKIMAKIKEFDLVNFFIQYKNGELDDEQVIKGFQYLIRTGIAWKIQGHYERKAKEFIDNGICTE